ncbi:carbohydrate ABC transporter permease [Thalassobius sp. Cn5-15]|uniref:carbohydrate ABC transporter permease n=1 Tax=Thalassobius sp. Cn5-15 TaxID=2917763 RepID=UPI001EF339C4|nr:sugar ABC transporter permease [Thalassobius sp. Cn5-15]MCG7495040.1 sugar ABC transporter permease [Thalassobius sp. Cn5-15]
MPSLTKQERDVRKRKAARRQTLISYILLLPYLALMVMFAVFPVLYAFGLSFFDTFENVFWGLTNYREALNDYRLVPAIWNVTQYVLVWVSMMVIGVTLLALLLDTLSERPAAIVRSIYFMPGAIASSAVVVLWLFLLDPLVSPFSFVFEAVGWDNRQSTISGLGEVWIFALMGFLGNSGGWIVVLGGALSGLSRDIIEAARIDGANPWQMATRIKIPMISKTITLMAIMTLAVGMQIFVEPQLMSLAGGQFDKPDWSVTQLAYFYAFRFGDFGVAAAISTLSLVLPLIIAFTLIFATRFYKID